MTNRFKHFLEWILERCSYNNREVRARNLILTADRLSVEQVSMLENRLSADPNYLKGRILLLGYYSRIQFQPHNDEDKRAQHAAWIFRNQPMHPIARNPALSFDAHANKARYELLKEIWLEQVQTFSTNTRVLSNAARYFILQDSEIAERCLIQALAIKPGDKTLTGELAFLYTVWDGHLSEALRTTESLCSGPDSEDLLHEITSLPELAYKAGELDKATQAAERLLELCEKYKHRTKCGDGINAGHTVLGRIALKNANIERAEFHLSESIVDIATPVTTSFGASLDLASELQEAGSTSAVIAYLDNYELLCGVNHDRGFEIRYKIEYPQLSCSKDSEHYAQSKLDHQICALRGFGPAGHKHLKYLIERTQKAIERWKFRKAGVEDSDELTSYAAREEAMERKRLDALVNLLSELEHR